MQILFIHGMGRTPLSGQLMLWRLRRRGFTTRSFGYATCLQDFRAIRDRLGQRLTRVAREGAYAVVAHSLGGVLLRAALAELPASTPRPVRVVLLGSPVTAVRMAHQLRNRFLYRLLAGDCGQLLASGARMAAIGGPGVPTTSLVGTRGRYGRWGPFGEEQNDGIVSLSEVSADWIAEVIQVPVMHTFLPASRLVADLVARSLGQGAAGRGGAFFT